MEPCSSATEQRPRWAFLALLPVALAAGGCGHADDAPAPEIAVSNPYLAAIARDLLGSDARILVLSSPQQCPGHFDITPQQVAALRRCRVFLRFDFQQHFDAKLQGLGEHPPRAVPVTVPAGLCVPASYLSAARHVATALTDVGLLTPQRQGERLAAIEARLLDLSQRCHAAVRAAGLAGQPVLASTHQEAFCSFLGLRVVGTFGREDDPAALDGLVRAGRQENVQLVIGNVPQGNTVPRRLAQVLGGRAVLFDNLPATDDEFAFDRLVEGNVERLGGGR